MTFEKGQRVESDSERDSVGNTCIYTGTVLYTPRAFTDVTVKWDTGELTSLPAKELRPEGGAR